MCDPVQEAENAFSSAEDLGQSAIDTVVKAPEKILKTAQTLVRTANKTVDNIIRNPLPTIEVAVLTAMGVPAPIASAAVSAANGGKLEDIALSAATAFAAAEISEMAGDEYFDKQTVESLGPQYADEALIRQVIASSSGTAAAVALRGGSFEQVLKAGVTGAVDGYVTTALKDSGYTKYDSKLVASASSAATKAILNGQNVAMAIGASVAATTISAAIDGKVGQINKNNELGKSAYDSFAPLKEKADKYFTDNVDLFQKTEKANYDNYVAARDDYIKLKDEFDAQYKIWEDNKTTDVDTANKAADAANAMVPKMDTSGAYLKAATDAFTGSSTDAQRVRDIYKTEYVAPMMLAKALK
jgi:hypothetical protein